MVAVVVSPLGFEPRIHALKGRYGSFCTELHSAASSCKSPVFMRVSVHQLAGSPRNELQRIRLSCITFVSQWGGRKAAEALRVGDTVKFSTPVLGVIQE